VVFKVKFTVSLTRGKRIQILRDQKGNDKGSLLYAKLNKTDYKIIISIYCIKSMLHR